MTQRAHQRGDGAIGRIAHLAQSLRSQSADPVVAILAAPGSGRERRRPPRSVRSCPVLPRLWHARDRCRHLWREPGPGPPPLPPHRWSRELRLSGRARHCRGFPARAKASLAAAELSGPTWAIASAAAVRTDSSRSCKSGTSARTEGAATLPRAPSARDADTLTIALASSRSVTSAGTVARVCRAQARPVHSPPGSAPSHHLAARGRPASERPTLRRDRYGPAPGPPAT